MSTAVAITNKINDLIDTKRVELGIEKKEAFVHALLLLALSDTALLQQAKTITEYFEHKGADALESKGL